MTVRTVAVVLTWNSADDTIACVDSLRAQTGTAVDVVVVDNASSDGSADALAARFPTVPVLRSDSNRGYAGGNNIGIRYALDRDYEYIFVINNDTLLETDALRALVEQLDAHPEAGIASPKILYEGDRARIYAAGGYMSRLTCTGVAGSQGHRDEPSDDHTSAVRSVTFVSGCALLVRSSVFRSVGLLSERFFMYFEDLEFSTRVRASYAMLYVPSSRIYHKVGAGVSWRAYSSLYHYYYTRNRLWFFLDGPAWYRPYVVLFTLANVIVKSMLLFAWSPGSADASERRIKMKSLWRGFVDGVRLRSEPPGGRYA